jgi:translin
MNKDADLSVVPLASLEQLADEARQYFDRKNAARENALARSREVIRLSANTIRAVHRREFARANSLLADARAALDSAVASLTAYGDILYAGFVHDAQKEYAEASAVLAILGGKPLPGPEEMRVEWPAYLNGLGEAVGEIRRYLLDNLRRGAVDEGEILLRAMDDIYDILVTMDYPDGVTAGLRRTTDVTRGILEKTRGDLTVAARQQHLEGLLTAVANRATAARGEGPAEAT